MNIGYPTRKGSYKNGILEETPGRAKYYGLVIREFLLLIVISFVLAVPMAWYAGNQWLNSFAYRMNVSMWIFILTFQDMSSFLSQTGHTSNFCPYFKSKGHSSTEGPFCLNYD